MIPAGSLCFDVTTGSLGAYDGKDFIYCFGTAKCKEIPIERLILCKGIPKTVEEDLKKRFIVPIVCQAMNKQ